MHIFHGGTLYNRVRPRFFDQVGHETMYRGSPLSTRKNFLERFYQFLTQKNDFECTNFEMFQEVAHNLGKSDDDMI